MSRKRMSRGIDSAISSPESEAGALPSATPDGQMTGQCGQEVVPASHSRRRASKKRQPTVAISGPNLPDSSASVALQSSLESRLKARFGTGGSMEYSETWKGRATPAGRQYSAHTASAHRTSGNDCTGWPSPLSHDGRRQSGGVGSTNGTSLSRDVVVWVTGWATPAHRDKRSQSTKGEQLNSQVVHGLTSHLSAVETDSRVALVLNPAMSRWLMGFPSSWDKVSPGFEAWRKMHDAIASEGCEPTGTR